jgi:GH15 family glucan-1,4-alpha-glucosidase
MSYVRASGDEAFAEQARGQVDRAVLYCRERTLNPYLNLVETNGSIHGQDVSVGYELWNNCAHAAAFALCHRVYGGRRYRRLALLIRRAIGLLLTAEGRFLRRLDSNGFPDPRPDICILAPYYFRLWTPGERYVMNSADLVEKSLWNVEIGGYIRLLPFSTAERSTPFGPSPLFTAWMAQYHYEQGNKDRAEAIMRWIFDQSVDGQLPEVVVPTVSAGRYLAEQRRAAVDGGESHADSWHRHRLADLETVEEALGQSEIVPLGVPSVWAHLEALRALRKGGLVQDWEPFD